MKRIAIKLVVFLLLGAVVNVAVAWGCAGLKEIRLWDDASADWATPIEEEQWARHVPEAFAGRSPYVWIFRDAWGNSDKAMLDLDYPSESLLITRRSGWPARCVEGAYRPYPRGYSPSLVVGDKRLLPLAPLFPGFLVNTLFYSLVLWLLWSAPFATRRLIRKRRGRCVRCGYDLGHAEHDVCPECGA